MLFGMRFQFQVIKKGLETQWRTKVSYKTTNFVRKKEINVDICIIFFN